ncbi:MAG: hypothetical protein ACJ8R9_31170 [Steroidobacteraceae bacterium]
MTPTHRKYVPAIRTSKLAAWIEYNEGDQRWHVEAFARNREGVQHLEAKYEGNQPSEDLLIRHAFDFGHFSPRPCSLDRQFDPSMTHGLLALLRHWCRIHSVDIEKLMREAYPNEPHRAEGIEEIVAQAEWEGIEYPPPDDRYQTRRLLLALRDVGYKEVAAVLVRVIRRLP